MTQLASTYDAFVMNTRSGAMTEYTNYEFNSFAKIGNSYYGAGPNGLFRLDGTTDNGENIDWVVETGMHDDKDTRLKRMPELVMALRANQAIRVRIHHDDLRYNDYVIPASKRDTIYQTRAVLGKGVRSRYFGVELQGLNNADLELDSMQMEMTTTTRRLG